MKNNSIPVYDIGTISAFEKEHILMSKFAPYSKTHQNLHYPHRHNFFHLIYFTEGSGNHTIDFEVFPVNPHQIYFMSPGQVHCWNFKGDVDGYVINFSTEFYKSFLLKQNFLDEFAFFTGSVENSVIDIPQPNQGEIVRLFEEILIEGSFNKTFSQEMVKILLLKIFIIVARIKGESNSSVNFSYNYTVLKNFQQLLERNYLTFRLPKEYAEMLYITPHHLNALCNDMLGISTGEVIRNRVVLEAKRMLVNLEFSISEISFKLNFKDNSYFSKFFKKQVGVTPEEFRKNTWNKDS